MRRRCEYDAFDEIYLESFAKLTEHESVAVARAMYYCKTHQICPPTWLVEKAATLLIELLKREKGMGRGRPNRLARFKKDYAKRERWEAVESVHSIRADHKSDDGLLKILSKHEPGADRRKFHKARGDWLKQGTYECAAELLEQEYSRASTSTIQDSHVEVEDAIERGTDMTAIWFDDSFLESLGVKKAQVKSRVKKSRFF